MSPHPVRLRIGTPARMDRVQVLIRILLLAAVGTVGCSSVYWLVYLALPAVAALVVSQKGAERYLSEDAPRIARGLRWLAAAYAYLWLLTDDFPMSNPGRRVTLEIDAGGIPTIASALARAIASLPALVFLAVLSAAAGLLWLVGAVSILAVQRIPKGVSDFLALTLCYQFRLLAYHSSIVDRYPSVELPLPNLPHSDAV
jgi:Domain of unknown function (DUF4389)